MANETKNETLFRRCFNAVSRALKAFPIAAILAMAAGALVIAFPHGALSVLIRIIGGLIVLCGALRILWLLFGDENLGLGIVLVFGLFWNVFLITSGAVLIAYPDFSIAFFSVFVGVWLVADAGAKLYRLLMARTLLASRFGLSIENAPLRAVYVAVCVLALVAGVLLLVYPKEASDALAVVAGISLVIGGMQNVVFYFANALAAKTNKPAASDPIESVDFEDKTGE